MAELLEVWSIPLNKLIARSLFVGLVTDTGWFQHSNTRPYTLRLAARLVEAGVDTDSIYQALYQNERAERVALQTRGLQSLELMANGRLAVMRLAKFDFEQTRGSTLDTENLVNIPLQIRKVEAALLLVEPPDGGPIRISARSKGRIDVARFAERFGGGGHARASGMKITGSLQAAHDAIVDAMAQAVGDIPD